MTNPSPPGLRHDSNSIAKLVREDVRRQTQYLTQTNRPSSSGVHSNRNRRTTDGLPICNKCDKVGHIARNCRAGGMQHQLPQIPQHNFQVRPSMQHQRKLHLSIIHIFVLACNTSLRRDPSLIQTFVLMLPRSILNKGKLPTTHLIQNRETNGCFLIPRR